MTKVIMRRLDLGFNPSKLADNTVLALSAIKRGSKVPLESLKEGIDLCNYLIFLFEPEKSIYQKEQWAIHSGRDRKTLQESNIDSAYVVEKVKETKRLIEGIMERKGLFETDLVENIQEFLIKVTMPLWQKCMAKFRERKLKW